jgi:SagB-type dehydrogenase family enzyme
MKKYIYLAFLALVLSCKPTVMPEPISNLPKPEIKGGKPLMVALLNRRTTRDFSEKDLTMQQISNLLWAANGINRPKTGGHTAPTSQNKQELDIYVAMKSGVYFFDADNHSLKKLFNDDIRSFIGEQDFHKIAPIELIVVADYSKTDTLNEGQRRTASIDAGYISQNIYLFCASENLATVAVGWIKYEILAEKLRLRNNQEIIIAHPVGFKK